MKVTTNITFDFSASLERLDSILESAESFDETNVIPGSDRLTYSNGFYINCYAVFIDIRESSNLSSRYQKRTLAKIYRCFISEVVACLQSFEDCREINIVGDSVWAVFDHADRDDVRQIINAASTCYSIVDVLNHKLKKKNIHPIKVGIGIDKGSALMIKAGFKGSKINDVIYMGGVVNNASKLCNKANKEVSKPIVMSPVVFADFKSSMLRGNTDAEAEFPQHSEGYYYGEITNAKIEAWLIEQN